MEQVFKTCSQESLCGRKVRTISLSGDQAMQGQVLEDLRQAVNYRRWLASLAAAWLGPRPIEIGSGVGDYAAEWVSSVSAVDEFTASEANAQRLAALRVRFADDPRVRVRELVAPILHDANHSAVVAYNVLEHISDDVAALRGFARLLEPKGRIVVLVPAFPLAMSCFDREIGHFRRYRRQSLLHAVRAAGLRPLRIHYVNAPGLLAWIVGMRLLRLRPQAGPALTVWDHIVPVFAAVERRMSPPFGQSLFCVAGL